MSLSACDLLLETDRTKIKIKKPEDIENLWNQNQLFEKWRGKYLGKENHPFNNIVGSVCQASLLSYNGENIFLGKDGFNIPN